MALDVIAKDALICHLPQILLAPSAHVHQQEQSSDEESETESNYSSDSDMSSTNSKRYKTEIVTDN